MSIMNFVPTCPWGLDSSTLPSIGESCYQSPKPHAVSRKYNRVYPSVSETQSIEPQSRATTESLSQPSKVATAKAPTAPGTEDQCLRFVNYDSVQSASRSLAQLVQVEKNLPGVNLAAKEQLLGKLPWGIDPDVLKTQVQELVNVMEAKQLRPITKSFCEVAVNGSWTLSYSSSVRDAIVENNSFLRVTLLGQSINCEQSKVLNYIHYQDSSNGTTGKFLVVCSMQFLAASRFQLNLQEHQLLPDPVKKDGTPINTAEIDVENLVAELQRIVPQEVFDPDNCVCDVTYVDHNLRVTRFMDPDHLQISHVLVRRVPTPQASSPAPRPK